MQNQRLKRIQQFPHPIQPIKEVSNLQKTPSLNPKRSNQIIEKLNNALQRRSSSNYETFKMFDTDKDGLVKRDDFTKTLAIMNICDKDEANGIFNSLAKTDQRQFLNFNDFHKGLSYEKRVDDYTRPVHMNRSRGNANSVSNPFLSKVNSQANSYTNFRTCKNLYFGIL